GDSRRRLRRLLKESPMFRPFRRALIVAALAFPVALGACSQSMKLVRSSVDPAFVPGSVKSVFVVGVSESPLMRKEYERVFVEQLQSSKLKVTPGSDLIPDIKTVDKDAVAVELKKMGVTHVLVTRVVDRKQVEQYHPPTYTTVGVGYGGYPGYYG